MASYLRVFLVFCAAFTAGAAMALDSKKISTGDSAAAQRGQLAQAQDETSMQAICREILVDTDEGYGVTSREPRVICDELR